EARHELVQVNGILSSTAPRAAVGRSLFEKVRDAKRLIAVIKQLIQRDFKSPRHLLQRFNGWDCVAIFDARNVAAQQPRSLFDISLGELFIFAQLAQTITDYHFHLSWLL